MKKKLYLIAIVFICLMTGIAFGQTVYYRNEATLQWDAVEVDSAGDPFLPTDIVEYEVYIYDHITGVTDPQDVSYLSFVGITSDTQMLIVFPYRTTWAAGARTKVTDEGGNVEYSNLAWSYISTDAGVDGPFLYVPFPTLRAPLNLRDSGI